MSTILIIEEEDRLVSMIKTSLLGNFTVISTATAAEAEKIIQDRLEEVDLVLLDAHIGKSSTLPLFDLITKLSPEKPIVIMSGLTFEDFKKAGARNFLPKPFGNTRFLSTLEKALSRPIS